MRLLLLSLVAAGALIQTGCAKLTPYDSVMETTARWSFFAVNDPKPSTFTEARANAEESRVLCLQVADAKQKATCNAAVDQLVSVIQSQEAK